jgi:hypothetical protein
MHVAGSATPPGTASWSQPHARLRVGQVALPVGPKTQHAGAASGQYIGHDSRDRAGYENSKRSPPRRKDRDNLSPFAGEASPCRNGDNYAQGTYAPYGAPRSRRADRCRLFRC